MDEFGTGHNRCKYTIFLMHVRTVRTFTVSNDILNDIAGLMGMHCGSCFSPLLHCTLESFRIINMTMSRSTTLKQLQSNNLLNLHFTPHTKRHGRWGRQTKSYVSDVMWLSVPASVKLLASSVKTLGD